MSIRRITELSGCRLDRDDEFICMTSSVHLDEVTHKNAWEYDPKRVIKQKWFDKNGRTVGNHSIPCGGGVSVYEGRCFASRELKAFMVFLLLRYNLEIDSKSVERPTFMLGRMGAGVMHPRGDPHARR